MKNTPAEPRIVAATKADVPLIRKFILELAEYERAKPGEAPVTEQDLEEFAGALDDVIAKAGRPTRVAGLALRAARAR